MINNGPETLRTAFTQNRTEELDADVWRHFVIPPFYDRLDLQQARKPRVIIGGRGCGKTMLLRYLSYHSTFSPSRPSVPPESIQHIGLYWRADTQFAKIMAGRGLSEESWDAAFNHLLALMVATELLNSLEAIWQSSLIPSPIQELRSLRFPILATFDSELGQEYEEVRIALQKKLHQFEYWVANVGKMNEPLFLPGRHFISILISECKRQSPHLKEALFFVYLDEYENLLEYQQRIVNTCLKHSQSPLIFNIAMKRNGFTTTRTVGEESIVDIADYRTHDIESYLDNGFDLFAAEVLLLTLHLARWSVPINAETLRNPEQLKNRRDSQYRDRVLTFIRDMFPGVSHENLARNIFSDEHMRSKLEKSIERALRQRMSDLTPKQFMRPKTPQASIVTTALLYRSIDPQTIIDELDALESGEQNRFTGPANWIQNNFIGCLLAVYESSSRICPFYAGFDTFTVMAKRNLRHFLELCHQSLNEVATTEDPSQTTVDPIKQAQAARHTSAAFLGQIRSFGRLGNRLHTFVLRLGSLFALSHQRPSQSEPEQSHFSITRGTRGLDEEDRIFLSEAVKWSVLFEEEETKTKDPLAISNVEYILNPIYAPYFNITYRKRRRLELNIDDFIILERGNYNEVNTLLRLYSEKWKVNLKEANPTLFSHLLEEA